MSIARYLSKLGALLNSDGKVPASGLAPDAVASAAIADGAVSSAKLASGAAASNLGNYVSSVNGSSGAVSVAAMGVGQSSQNVTASRALNTTYTNTSGKPIVVFVNMNYGDLSLYLNGNLTWFFTSGSSAKAQMVVPPDNTYSANAAAGRTFSQWFEYR